MTTGASGFSGSTARKGSAGGAPGILNRWPCLLGMSRMAACTAPAWPGDSFSSAERAATVSQMSAITMTLCPLRLRVHRVRVLPRCVGARGLPAADLGCCAGYLLGEHGEGAVADGNYGGGASAGLRVHFLTQSCDIVLCLLEIQFESAHGEPGDVGKNQRADDNDIGHPSFQRRRHCSLRPPGQRNPKDGKPAQDSERQPSRLDPAQPLQPPPPYAQPPQPPQPLFARTAAAFSPLILRRETRQPLPCAPPPPHASITDSPSTTR